MGWGSGGYARFATTKSVKREYSQILRGTVLVRYIRCGKPGCHCVSGDGHKVTYLSVSLTEGKTEQISLPKALVPEVKQWVSNYHRHRLSDKIDGFWTIHGLSKELGIDRNWFYRRIYSGKLREPNVIRKPPYGNYLIRDDPEFIQRLRTEVEQLHQKRAKSQT